MAGQAGDCGVVDNVEAQKSRGSLVGVFALKYTQSWQHCSV